jgi:hypothetical protein
MEATVRYQHHKGGAITERTIRLGDMFVPDAAKDEWREVLPNTGSLWPYSTALTAFKGAICQVDTSKGGWCEVETAGQKFAHPRQRARDNDAQWLAALP